MNKNKKRILVAYIFEVLLYLGEKEVEIQIN